MSAEVETCPRIVWTDWTNHTCGRPVKRRGLCGLHAAAEERAAGKELALREARSTRAAESAVTVARLGAHGVEAEVSYNGSVLLPDASDLADQLGPPLPRRRAMRLINAGQGTALDIAAATVLMLAAGLQLMRLGRWLWGLDATVCDALDVDWGDE